MVRKYLPASLDEALDILSRGPCYIVAGGSDVYVLKHNVAGLLPKFDKDVMFIADLPELLTIRDEKDGLHVGAAVTLETLLHDKRTPRLFKDVIAQIASPNIRHFATIAGNICNASPAGDTIVPEVLTDTLIKVVSRRGSRLVPAEDFMKGVRKIDLMPDEMVSEIIIPHHDFTKVEWTKVGSRKADTIAKISFAAAAKIEGDVVRDIHFCFGSVFIRMVRSHAIEEKLKNRTIQEIKAQIPDILTEYDALIKPIDDQRSTKVYRRQVALNLLRDFLERLTPEG